MLSEKPHIELNIVTMDDVQQYVDGRLPANRRNMIEETLIEDDRVREYITAKADGPQEPTDETIDLLGKAVTPCNDTIAKYQDLTLSESGERITDFVKGRLWGRRRLLDQLLSLSRVSEPANDQDDGAFSNFEPSKCVALAALADLELMIQLRSAFDAAKSPLWKAKIAGWISDVDNDRLRISWLASDLI
ncbi:hypothetical protein ABFZ85_06730 [Hyphococcus formosus]|uniref:hypothetical protein n=1 Tax=Hyphococcus formosus TaxID=3143534 RepID=UPI00398A8B02